ncbi:MAG: hypothetical protein PHV20_03955 [Bacteroidales bacterium]|nr:hypothetical protein [Bacteroidales bacterium]
MRKYICSTINILFFFLVILSYTVDLKAQRTMSILHKSGKKANISVNNIDSILFLSEDSVSLFSSVYNTDSKLSYTVINKTLSTTGDFFELRAKALSTTISELYTMLASPVGNVRFGWYNDTQMMLRTKASNVYTYFAVPSLIRSGYNIYKLLKTETGYDLFINNKIVGSSTQTDNFEIRRLCANGELNYSDGSKYDVDYLKIRASGEISSFYNLYRNINSVNVNKGYSEIIDTTDLAKVYVKSVVNGMPIGTSEIIHVYVKMKDLYYQHYQLVHEFNNTDIVFVNYWRIKGCKLSKFISGVFVDEPEILMTEFESEQVLQVGGKADATGGIHGDEQIVDNITFLANGQAVSIPRDSFLQCDSFSYVIKSTLHETARYVEKLTKNSIESVSGILSITSQHTFAIDGIDTGLDAYSINGYAAVNNLSDFSVSAKDGYWVINNYIEYNKDHPIFANHEKCTVFGESGYYTKNKVSLVSNQNLLIYSGICCVGVDAAQYCSDDNMQYQLMKDANFNYFTSTSPANRVQRGYNTKTNLSVFVTSRLLDKNDDYNAYFRIMYRGNDAKYYRQTSIYPNILYNSGKIFESEMKVRFYKK